MSSTPEIPDARLLEAHDLALTALREITPDATIGAAAGYLAEDDGVVSLRFATRLAGYPGWYWTVSLARVEGAEPTVLEAELLPGDGALLAPEWVPWAERLAEYHAQQAALAQAGIDDELDAEDDELDDDEDESDEDEADASSLLHAGDVDGLDIDGFEDDGLDEDDDLDEDGIEDDLLEVVELEDEAFDDLDEDERDRSY